MSEPISPQVSQHTQPIQNLQRTILPQNSQSTDIAQNRQLTNPPQNQTPHQPYLRIPLTSPCHISDHSILSPDTPLNLDP